MSSLSLALAGAVILAATGGLSLLLYRAPRLAVRVCTAGAVAGGIVGLGGAFLTLYGGLDRTMSAPWHVPGGALTVGLDPLSAFFLVPLFALGALAAIYGGRYLEGRVLPAAELNGLLAAMALVLLARNALLFLVAWEVMTLLAYLLVTVAHGETEVRRAGWSYLIASHVAVTALLALFVGLGARAGGGLELGPLPEPLSPLTTAVFLGLALLGFGIKAGVIGLHVWLPEAHAAAPSHVSALMSGALIKLGLYGLLRVATIVPPPPWFAVVLMLAGVGGALIGIALAVYQRDVKRVLAYSSVENIGVILVGLGLGFWARARGDGLLAAMGFGAALLHVWNHAAMKGLMFLGAGSLLHGARTKDLEQLGGLLRRMPWTASALVLGGVAIAALPPLNGFMSEWLLYRGLARVAVHDMSGAALSAMGGGGALALVGGLACLCFVRLIGAALLGSPRSDAAARAHESPPAMTLPMAALALTCIALAVGAPWVLSALGAVLAQLHGADTAAVALTSQALVPVATTSAVLLGALVIATALVVRFARGTAVETWGCGYAAPSARMQYTGRAFAELLTARVLPRWLRAREELVPPKGPFPAAAHFVSDSTDPLTRSAYEPFLSRWGDRFARLRFLQQGNVHIYILYIVVTAILGLAWVATRDWLSP